MNREEMLKRLKQGADPLDLSIRKWQDIVKGKGKNSGMDNCALCEVYAKHANAQNWCMECPVKKKTSQGQCLNTPYEKYTDVFFAQASGDDNINDVDLKLLAQLEVDFLKGLKETSEK